MAGQTIVRTIRTVLDSLVGEICKPPPNQDSKRFYPSDKTIRNHIYAGIHQHRKGDDQASLVDMVGF